MDRRKKNQIQSKQQIPEAPEYAEYYKYDYSCLVPTYEYTAKINTCSEDITDIKSSRILYNSIYDYSISDDLPQSYHRDNYCMIPYRVPAMSLSGYVYELNQSIVTDSIPKISKHFGFEYDNKILYNGFMRLDAVVFKAYPEFRLILTSDKCVCVEGDPDVDVSGEKYDYVNNPELYQCGPLDSVSHSVGDVSDEYAFSWDDNWDMSTVRNSPGRRKPDDSDSSSSSSSSSAPGGSVYLCKIVTPPSGNGGTATVRVISVSGSGAVYEGKTLVVNVPSI